MNLSVSNTIKLKGKVMVPGSKSQSIRAMLFALLAQGESSLRNVLIAEDTEVAIKICEELGAKVQWLNGELKIYSEGLPLDNLADKIYTGNSGITTRFILPLLGLRKYSQSIRVDCGLQMRLRPIEPLVSALNQLGMHIQYAEEENRLPLIVSGFLQGGAVEIDGLSSQYLSALLISLPLAEQDSVITVNNLHERPYVDMTLAWLQQQKIIYSHMQSKNSDTFYVRGRQKYQPIHVQIKGDFSAAASLIAAGVLFPGELELQGLDLTDPQGDKRLLTILQDMGAEIHIEASNIKIKGKQQLKGIRIDARDVPDLVPTLAVMGTQAEGTTEIYNVKQARIKETDRIHSMVTGLTKMGAQIAEQNDGMLIQQSNLHGSFVNGFQDHRTVMALTIAGMLADGLTTITDGESINKTYPEFVKIMQQLGAKICVKKNISKQHIILIGFKHTGKTRVGRELAKTLNKSFVDIDNEIENFYAEKHSQQLTCRQIMQTHDEGYFRKLENDILDQVLNQTASVIALGGGTSLHQDNQDKLKQHLLLHVTAPRGIVFERIMIEGRPAFFDPNINPYIAFTELWEKRNSIYKQLTTQIINNDGTIEQAVSAAQHILKNQTSEPL